MNEPRQFCARIKVKAYPTVELGGIVWAYMGPSDKQPAPPKFAWTQVPETHRNVSKVVQSCNWLQALEGGIDTSHFTILHRALKQNALQPGIDPTGVAVRGAAPTLEVDVTDYGYRYYGIRPLGEDERYVRGYHFVMPFTQLRPPGPDKEQVHGHYWVPIDDETTLVWNFYYSYGAEPVDKESFEGSGNSYGTHVDPANGFRPTFNRANDWGLDRRMQKTETFSGIDGINQQDRAVQESMGPIVDRTRENLGPADRAVIATRKLLLDAVAAVARNEDPIGTGTSYYEVRAAEAVLSRDVDWRSELLPRMDRQFGEPSKPPAARARGGAGLEVTLPLRAPNT
jgi:phenylpropionate dioxygenase-like ring-hydroxylating dioxygenase large terminal subunit